ncbi:pseudouridylate synthase TRUB1-like [Zophobas morio]|uniref:pseudouridylate synthase TRUB1-like n=1 Tax=Zophobas morio TaxID=2755281 RepID=UPI0030830533
MNSLRTTDVVVSLLKFSGDYKKCKVGHGGTLDKLAEGVLVIGINQGCRFLNDLLKGPKSYEVVGKLGLETDTLDLGGNIIRTADDDHVDESLINSVLPLFIGETEQEAPIYSSLKINGKTSADRVRSGEHVEAKVRKVIIYDIVLTKYESHVDHKSFTLAVTCGAGTYVRSLVRDIGRKVNSAATATTIIRTSQGPFSIVNSSSSSSLPVYKYEEITFEKIIEALDNFKYKQLIKC